MDDARQAQLQRGFAALQAAASSTARPVGDAVLLLRNCPLVGPNAFNLGRTTVVLTDAMVSFASNLDDSKNDSALMGVLAHELGHLQNDHVIRGLFRNQFTRSFEREADNEALLRLQAAGISSKPLAAMFKKLSTHEPNSKKIEWLFSHPDSGERAKLFER